MKKVRKARITESLVRVCLMFVVITILALLGLIAYQYGYDFGTRIGLDLYNYVK